MVVVAIALAFVAGAAAQCSGVVGGRKFDLTGLAGDYRVTDPAGYYVYSIGVCKPPAFTTCTQSAAVCQMYDPWELRLNLGSVDTATLAPNDAGDSVTLTYSGGDDCGAGFYSTIILFTCDREAGDGAPVYHSYDFNTCTYRFAWRSAQACSGGCLGIVSGQYYDLQLSGDYAATDGSHLIPIGVCATPPRSKCASTVAGCLMYPEWGINLDLGKIDTGYLLPQRVGTAIVLTYQGGATCDTGGLYAMTISFQCNQGGPDGQPTLLSFDAATCVYHFAWSSGQACPKTPPAALNNTLIR